MENYKTLEQINNDISLTPKQKEIERIIFSHAFTHKESGNMLRQLSALNEDLKGSLHYHGSNYTKHLIIASDELIGSLKH